MNFLSKILEDSYVKTSSVLHEIKSSILVGENEYHRRLNICKSCDKLNNNFCLECHCYMPAKCAIKDVDCALDKWNKDND